jgi:hypothetical protein
MLLKDIIKNPEILDKITKDQKHRVSPDGMWIEDTATHK